MVDLQWWFCKSRGSKIYLSARSVVDGGFIATAILAFLGTYLPLFEGLRIARTVRYFYILRVIRIVRLTQLFKFMQFDSGEKESKQFKYTIWICTLSLSSFLVLTINYIHSAYPAEVSSIMEFYLILGLLVSDRLSFDRAGSNTGSN